MANTEKAQKAPAGNKPAQASVAGLQVGEAEWTETEKVILARRSVRLFKKEQVPEHMIRRILEAGRFAPSAGNCQPWRFIVLREKALLDELENEVVNMCKKAAKLIDYRKNPAAKPLAKTLIWLRHNDFHPVPWGAVSLIAEGKLRLWHNAPSVILILKDKRGVSNPDLDCGICGQNMVLAAHSMGLGTCWVGFIKLLQYMPGRLKQLDISYPYELINSIAIGWPQGEPDGYVERELHAIDWYENGQKTVIY